MNTYARQSIAFTKGEGVWLWDTNGKRYLDGLSGVAVNTLGHAHPAFVKALCEQSGTLIHTSNLYQILRQEELADKLAALSKMDSVFFCNSGAEANETAIKIARLYGHQRGIEQPTIIVMEKAFHGRTLATLSATGNRKAQAGFEPLVSGFIRVPYNDLEAIKQIAEHNRQITAVLIEVLQGEGGIRIADPEFIKGLRQLCDQNQWLLMIDEVQSGIGRTGKWFAHQHIGITPDVMTLAKGLGSGLPIGACLAKGPADVFKPGNHGSTFGGNPLVCAAALATFEIIEKEKLLDHAAKLGDWICQEMRKQLAGVAGVVEVRGKGLMIGTELDRPCADIVKLGLERGLLINVTAEKIVRFLPPLIMQQAEAKTLVDETCAIIKDFLK
jgi:acetylornithine aminotransferase